jgi:hypothetical protein
VPPGHVRSLEDYYWWLARLFDGVRAYLDSGDELIVQLFPDAVDPDLLSVPRQTLYFLNNTKLSILFDVRAETLECTRYCYDFRYVDGLLIWRHDKHQKGTHGVICHRHFPEDNGGEPWEPCEEVDIEDVLDEAMSFSP